MEEQLISFDTAKLAKEKGFNIPTISYYNPKGRSEESEGYMTERLECSNWNDGQGSYPTHAKDVECSAPTQSLLQKWLREVHNTDVYCIPWIYENKRVYDFFVNYEGESRAYSSYEKALEVGLQEALKLIK